MSSDLPITQHQQLSTDNQLRFIYTTTHFLCLLIFKVYPRYYIITSLNISIYISKK